MLLKQNESDTNRSELRIIAIGGLLRELEVDQTCTTRRIYDNVARAKVAMHPAMLMQDLHHYKDLQSCYER